MSQHAEPLMWKTSSYTDSGACVEWARPPGGVLVRDTKDREGALVSVAAAPWQAFVDWTVD